MQMNMKKHNMVKKGKNKKRGLLPFVAKTMDNTSFAFYLAFTGVVIQFIHNVLAIAGTFDLFSPDEPVLLVIGEWLLAIMIAFFFAYTLFYFTIRTGTITIPDNRKSEETKREYVKLKRKYSGINWGFSIFDTLIDFYFWIYIVFMGSDIDLSNVSGLISGMQERWILLVVILPITIMLPQTLRFYTKEIELNKWLIHNE